MPAQHLSPLSADVAGAAAAARRRPIGKSREGVNEDDLVAVDPRYVHLIEPIRDLVKNFRIDVAAELEDYLDELMDVTFALDGDDAHRQLNFAEAALLIQGSACIYARKVEYLTKLLFRALEEVHARRQRKKRPDPLATEDKSEKDAVAAVDDVDVLFSIDDFVKLDDLPQATVEELDLNAAEFEAAANKPSKRYVWQDDDDTAEFLRQIDRRSSLGIAIGNLAPLKPGDKDVRLAGEMDAFRINTLPTTERGGLRFHSDNFEPFIEANHQKRAKDLNSDTLQPAGPQHIEHLVDYGAGGFDDGFDDHADMPLFEFQPEGEEFELGHATAANDGTSAVGFGLTRDQLAKMPLSEVRRLMEQQRSNAVRDAERESDIQEEENDGQNDLWTFHDIHEEAKPAQLRPRRIGKTHTLPPSLRANKPENANPTSQLSAFTLTQKQQTAGLKARGKLSVSLWPEFDYAFSRVARRRADLLRKFRLLDPVTKTFPVFPHSPARFGKSKNVRSDRTDFQQDFNDELSNEDGYRAAGIPPPEMDDYGAGGFDDGFDDHGVFEDYAPQVRTDFEDGRSQIAAPLGTDIRHTAQQEAPNVISYAELCRQHIDQYMRAAEEAITLSRLQAEVADWQERIEPTLECIESMPHFSIADYGRRIVAAFGNAANAPSLKRPKTDANLGSGGEINDSQLTLSDLCTRMALPDSSLVQTSFVKAKSSTHASAMLDVSLTHYSGDVPQFDVCRSFVAALQLVNNGNIALEPLNVDAEGTAHDLSLRLLDATVVDAHQRVRKFASDDASAMTDEFFATDSDPIDDYDAFVVSRAAQAGMHGKSLLSLAKPQQSLDVGVDKRDLLGSQGGSQNALPSSKSPAAKRTRSFGTLIQESSQQ